jgi:hypothetical protein
MDAATSCANARLGPVEIFVPGLADTASYSSRSLTVGRFPQERSPWFAAEVRP